MGSRVYVNNFCKASCSYLLAIIMASMKRYCYTFEVVFPSEERKASFSDRIEAVRRRFEAPSGVRDSKMNNFDQLSRTIVLTLAKELESDDTRGGFQEPRPRPETRKLMNRSYMYYYNCHILLH